MIQKNFLKCFFFKNKLKSITNFLTNSADNWEIIKIVLSLPKIKLIKSLLKDR